MNIAVLLSGGKGLRMGLDTPKQYIRVSGKMLLTYCLETLLAHPLIHAVQIVAEVEWREAILADIRKSSLDTQKICGFSLPGDERQSSIFNALRDLRSCNTRLDMGCVHDNVPAYAPVCNISIMSAHNAVFAHSTLIIHDAVRPNLSKEQITACFAALKEHDGVMPVLPMKDTVYLSDSDGHISELLDRDSVFAGQTPEVFALDKYYNANLKLLPDRLQIIKGSTEPAVLAGMDIAMIPGDENNYKITTRADLDRFRKQKEVMKKG